MLPLSGLRSLRESFGAPDDVEELLGDLLLPRLVELNGQDLDHLLRVLGRRFHRGHPRPVLARQRLHERPEDLGPDVTWEELAQNRLRAWLVQVVDDRARAARRCARAA